MAQAVEVKDHGGEQNAVLGRDRANEFRVAAFGDSVMWGQGLERSRRFSWLIADAIASVEGKRAVIAYDFSRSGAKINATLSERRAFVDTFPEIFTAINGQTARQARRAFVEADDQRIANDLYGDVPATFPTVSWQVNNLNARVGSTIDLALVSGGGNDIGLDNLLDPDEFEGVFIPTWEALFTKIAYEDTYELLERVRARCPNAVILYFGYFPPFSHESSAVQMSDMARFFLDHDLHWQVNKVFGFKDIAAILQEVRARSVWALGRAAFWQKQAIQLANLDPTVRGPGIIFSPSGYVPANSALAPQPLVHEDYSHPTGDDLRDPRLAATRRIAQLQVLERLAAYQNRTLDPVLKVTTLRTIRSDLTGSGKLRGALADLIRVLGRGDNATVFRARIAVGEAAAEEVERIQRTRIASFIHPNRAGARQYADIAVRRYTEHKDLLASLTPQPGDGSGQHGGVPGSPETPEELLTRYGLRGTGSVLADFGHLDVDSLGVWAVTARNSDRLLVPSIYLVVETRDDVGNAGSRRYRLNMPVRADIQQPPGQQLPIVTVKKYHPEFEPATSTSCTVDPGTSLRLGDISRMSLEMGPNDLAGPFQGDHGSIWRPRRIILMINGVTVHDQVFQTRELAPGGRLRFAYPPPRGGNGPVIVSTRRSQPGVLLSAGVGPGLG